MARISFFIIFISLFFALVGVNFVIANETNNHESEIQKGKELVENEVNCDQLIDEQLEAIGEYLMEQMHPGESHEAMHQMMGMVKGTEYHKQFHINLSKTLYCGQNGMPMTQMMPMMQMMIGGNTRMGISENMMSWTGTRILDGSLWQWVIRLSFLVWLVVGILVTIWLWKQINKK